MYKRREQQGKVKVSVTQLMYEQFLGLFPVQGLVCCLGRATGAVLAAACAWCERLIH